MLEVKRKLDVFLELSIYLVFNQVFRFYYFREDDGG